MSEDRVDDPLLIFEGESSDRVTYIKPEPETNQLSSSVRQMLQKAATAVQQQDWSTVNYYLKLLPQSSKSSTSHQILLTGANWQQGFDLAVITLLEGDFQQQWEVCKLLPSFGQQIVLPLVELLQDETLESDTRWFICQILGHFPQPEVIIALIELLQHTDEPELKEAAGQTLTAIGTVAVDALTKLLNVPETRTLAVESLFYIRTSATIEPLLEVAQDPAPQLRAIAIKALGSFHDSRIPPVLIAALQDRASGVRQEAVTALGFRRDLCESLHLVSHLRPLLQDFSLAVCRLTAISLGRMQHPSATRALFEVLEANTTPVELKLELIKALGWSNIRQGIDYLAKALVSSTGIVTQEIIITLGRISLSSLKPQAATVLIDWWREYQPESSPVKQALATSLGELGDRDAREILLHLGDDGDRKVQLYAQSALRKLT